MSANPVHDTPAVDPAAIEPTTTASEANIDPIRPIGTDALTAESRPELDTTTGEAESGTPAVATTTEPSNELVGENAAKVEAQPIAEGLLGYKAPGLVKSLRFSKKFFWFDDAAVDPSALSTYLRSEKPEIGHHNAALATQTGKGLLFFAKRIEDKSHPVGIIKLSDASDVTKEGLNDFSFRVHGHKHTFQAPTSAERDSWLVAVETKLGEAKSTHEGVIGSDGYKNHMSKFAGVVAPTTAANAATTRSTTASGLDGKAHDVNVQNGEAAAATTTPSKEGTTNRVDKSRSQSRKRASIFGTLRGKKDEHEEKKDVKAEQKAEQKEAKKEEKAEKKEIKNEEKAERKEIKDEEKAEKSVEKAEAKAEKGEKAELKEEKHDVNKPAPFDAAAIAARVVGAPVEPVNGAEPTVAPETVSPTPAETTSNRDTTTKPNKRNSIFSNLFNKRENVSPTRERKEEDASVAPIKESEPSIVTAAAPQLEHPVRTSSVQASAKPLSTAAASATATNETKSSQPESKGGIFGFIKQKEAQHDEKKDTKAEENDEVPAVARGTPTAPGNAISATESPAIGTTTSATATSPDVPKERRRQSFFGTLGGKKERRTDALSDAEVTDGEGKKSSSGKLGGIFRKASRSARSTGSNKPTTDAPAPISKDTPAITEASTNGESAVGSTANGMSGNNEESTLGDMPENMTSERSQPAAVQASA
ncbi:hypothetical protein MMC06_003551 [Schaereria dolodes]|nr:hypothetical protein [Schaereria dolodes]